MKYTFDLDTTCNEENALKLEESLKYAEAASDMASRIYDADSKVKALTLAVKICNLYGNDILANIFYQQTKTSLSPKSDHSSEEKYNSEAFEKKILDTNIPELPNVVSNNSLSKLSSINLDHPKNAANDLLNIIITLSLKTLTAEIKRDIKEADEFIITAEKGLKEIMEQSLQITSIKSDSELLTGAPSALTGDDIDILLSGVVG
ncbi:MAG: hypothetical protein NWS20_00365 [Rickettsiaceae bacterium]|nr:hypothetical protein [Rickettsiaceae bacterium]